MFPWPHGEKIIFLEFSGSGMQIEGGQNTISTFAPSLSNTLGALIIQVAKVFKL